MFVTKKSLSRRTVLKAMGAAVGLPFLESMVPAFTPLARSAAVPPRRFGAVYFPNGAIMQQFTPAAVGSGFEFTSILNPWSHLKSSSSSSRILLVRIREARWAITQ